MASITNLLRQLLTVIATNKHALWIAVLAHILFKFIPFNSYAGIVSNMDFFGREVFFTLLHEGLFITITWLVISKIVNPDKLVPLRTFASLYFSALAVSTLVTILLFYIFSLIPFKAPYDTVGEISGGIGWIIRNIVLWSLFFSGVLLAKRASQR